MQNHNVHSHTVGGLKYEVQHPGFPVKEGGMACRAVILALSLTLVSLHRPILQNFFQDLRKIAPAALIFLAVRLHCLRQSALLEQFCVSPMDFCAFEQ